MASPAARKFWDTGIWLSEAWKVYADKSSNLKLEADFDFSDALNHINGDANSIDWKGGIAVISAWTDASRQKRELAAAMKNNLIDRLLNSQLVATGYRETPSVSSSPVFIEPAHFNGCKLNWEISQVTAHGRQWGSVKISQPSVSAPSANRGSGNAIRLAILELQNERVNFNSIPRKKGVHLIRIKLGQKHELGNGLSDVNLAKLIVEVCGKKGLSKPI